MDQTKNRLSGDELASATQKYKEAQRDATNYMLDQKHSGLRGAPPLKNPDRHAPRRTRAQELKAERIILGISRRKYDELRDKWSLNNGKLNSNERVAIAASAMLQEECNGQR